MGSVNLSLAGTFTGNKLKLLLLQLFSCFPRNVKANNQICMNYMEIAGKSMSSTWHSVNRIVTHSCSFIQTLIIVQFRIIHKALFIRLSYWMETILIRYSASSVMAAWRRKSEKYRSRNDIQHSHVGFFTL